MADVADWYTPRISRRAAIARALAAKGPEFLRGMRLKASDLDAIARLGDEAEAADRDQQIQLAEQRVARAGRSTSAVDVREREDDLAATLPAITLELHEAGNTSDAAFLAKLSFARYRLRVHEVPVDAPTDAERTTLRTLERVAKSDLATRASGLASLCTTLAARPAIVAALSERGLDAAALQELAEDATAVAASGTNAPRPVEATERERAAVRAQKVKWSAVRSLVRRACRGDRELESLLAGC